MIIVKMVMVLSAPPCPKWRNGGAKHPGPKPDQGAQRPTLRTSQAMEGNNNTSQSRVNEMEN